MSKREKNNENDNLNLKRISSALAKKNYKVRKIIENTWKYKRTLEN